ncbi:hypothetical protein DSO57_1015832, partial [Entomophthora muscae]
ISFGNFTKQYLKLHWWLIINSMWTWWVIPHHMEIASYYPVISVTVCTTEEKQDPAEVVTFAANKSASGYFLFYGSIDSGQTINQPAILLDTGVSEKFMSVETAD